MLRKNVIGCVAILLAAIATCAFARQGTLIVHQSAELGLSKVTVGGVQYDRVSLPRLMNTMTAGAPELPAQLVK